VVLLVVVVLAAIPFYASSRSGNDFIVGKINNSIDGKVDIGLLSVGWFKGIVIDRFKFNDNAGLTHVSVEKITTKPSYLSFLTSQPNLGKTVIDKPEVYLKLSSEKPADVSSPSTGAIAETGPTETSASAPMGFAKIDLEVNNGNVTIEADSGKKVEFRNIGAKVDLKGLNNYNKLNIVASIEDGVSDTNSSIKADGKVLPVADNKGWSLKGTSGEFNVKVDSVDLESLQPLFDLMDAGVNAKGIVDVNIAVAVDKGAVSEIVGRVDCKDIDIALAALKGDRIQSKTIGTDIKITGDNESYNFEKFDVMSDWLVINGSGKLGKAAGFKGEFEMRFNLDIAKAAQTMPKTFYVREGVNITGGTLAGNLLCLTDQNKGDLVLNAELGGLKALAQGKTVSLSESVNFGIDVEQNQNLWNIKKGNVKSGFADIGCSGGLDSLKYSAKADLLKFQNELGQFFDFGGYNFKGQFEQQGNVKITDKAIAVDGLAKINNLAISKDGRSASEPAATADFSIDYNKDAKTLNIDKFNFNGQGGKLEVSANALAMGDSKADSTVKLNADIDLGKMMPFAVMAGAIPSEFGFAGKLKSDVDIAIKDKYISLRTIGTRIDNPDFTHQGKVLFKQDSVSLDFEGGVDLDDKSISIENMKLISPQIKLIKGQMTSKQTGNIKKIDAKFDYDIELAAVTEMVSPFLPDGFEISGRNADSLVFSSEYPVNDPNKMLANLNAKTKFGFDRASYMGLNFGKTEVDVEIISGQMTIKPFSTVVNEGMLKFAANANLGENPAILKMPEPILVLDKIHIDKIMANQLLKYLNPMFAQVADVSGLASFQCDRLAIPLSGGYNNRIVVEGTVWMNDVAIAGGGVMSQIVNLSGINNPNVKIEVLPTKFVFENGEMHYDNMQVNIGDTPLNFTGNVYLDKMMSMSVTLPWTVAGQTAKAGQEVSNRIKLAIEGPVNAPKLNTDKLIQDTGKQIIEQQLDKAFKDLFKK
jgi:hypothetical protein